MAIEAASTLAPAIVAGGRVFFALCVLFRPLSCCVACDMVFFYCSSPVPKFNFRQKVQIVGPPRATMALADDLPFYPPANILKLNRFPALFSCITHARQGPAHSMPRIFMGVWGQPMTTNGEREDQQI
jgi:hypothetical protein